MYKSKVLDPESRRWLAKAVKADPVLHKLTAAMKADERAEDRGVRTEIVSRSHNGHTTTVDYSAADFAAPASIDDPLFVLEAERTAAGISDEDVERAFSTLSDEQDEVNAAHAEAEEIERKRARSKAATVDVDQFARAGYHGRETPDKRDKAAKRARKAAKLGQQDLGLGLPPPRLGRACVGERYTSEGWGLRGFIVPAHKAPGKCIVVLDRRSLKELEAAKAAKASKGRGKGKAPTSQCKAMIVYVPPVFTLN